MRRAITALLSCLPFDTRSCRAIDETLLDWAHEESAPHRRRFVSLRGLMAVARAAAGCMAWEVTRVPVVPILGRAFAIVAVPVVLLSTRGWGHAGSRGYDMTTNAIVALALFAAPQIMFVLSPIALFLAVVHGLRARRIPILGAATLTLVALLLAGASVVPWANHQFHFVDTGARPLPAPPSDIWPGALVAAVADRPFGAGTGVLLFRTGVAALGAVLVFLASIVGRLKPSRRRGWISGVGVAYALCFAWFPSSWEFGGHAHALVGLMPWFLSGTALVAAIALGREIVPNSPSGSIV